MTISSLRRAEASTQGKTDSDKSERERKIKSLVKFVTTTTNNYKARMFAYKRLV